MDARHRKVPSPILCLQGQTHVKPVVVILFSMMIGISQASMGSNAAQAPLPATTTGSPAKTVTKKGPAHANSLIPRVPKPKLFRSNPLRKSLILSGSNPYETVDDEDYIANLPRRQLEIKKIKQADDDLSDYIKFRLFLARQLALLKYQEVHG